MLPKRSHTMKEINRGSQFSIRQFTRILNWSGAWQYVNQISCLMTWIIIHFAGTYSFQSTNLWSLRSKLLLRTGSGSSFRWNYRWNRTWSFPSKLPFKCQQGGPWWLWHWFHVSTENAQQSFNSDSQWLQHLVVHSGGPMLAWNCVWRLDVLSL